MQVRPELSFQRSSVHQKELCPKLLSRDRQRYEENVYVIRNVSKTVITELRFNLTEMTLEQLASSESSEAAAASGRLIQRTMRVPAPVEFAVSWRHISTKEVVLVPCEVAEITKNYLKIEKMHKTKSHERKCQGLLLLLEQMEADKLRNIVMGDESWFTLELRYSTKWSVSREDVPEKARLRINIKSSCSL
jgi:hypothetical protein